MITVIVAVFETAGRPHGIGKEDETKMPWTPHQAPRTPLIIAAVGQKHRQGGSVFRI